MNPPKTSDEPKDTKLKSVEIRAIQGIARRAIAVTGDQNTHLFFTFASFVLLTFRFFAGREDLWWRFCRVSPVR